jgi:hypothetical protein
MNRKLLSVAAIVCIAISVAAAPAHAINVVIDYTYDSSGFFGGGNPQGPAAGAQARATLEAAAAFYTNILEDSFSEISLPPLFHSSAFDGIATWEWRRTFRNPATGSLVLAPSGTIAADEYVVFAGARNLTSTGDSVTGGYGWSQTSSGGFSVAEFDQIDSINDAFGRQVKTRGETDGFAAWGGAVSFDSNPTAPWHYNRHLPPMGNVIDFYSVSLHELAHALGIGKSGEWDALRTGLTFSGTHAQASFGGPVPLADADHWADNVMSPILGTETPQLALMTATLATGTRRLLTELDAAGLRDIGWTVAAVPEPATGILSLAPFSAMWAVRRRER